MADEEGDHALALVDGEEDAAFVLVGPTPVRPEVILRALGIENVDLIDENGAPQPHPRLPSRDGLEDLPLRQERRVVVASSEFRDDVQGDVVRHDLNDLRPLPETEFAGGEDGFRQKPIPSAAGGAPEPPGAVFGVAV